MHAHSTCLTSIERHSEEYSMLVRLVKQPYKRIEHHDALQVCLFSVFSHSKLGIALQSHLYERVFLLFASATNGARKLGVVVMRVIRP